MGESTDPIPLMPLEPAMPAPTLPGRVKVEADSHGVWDALGAALMAFALDAVARRGEFHLALSGGSTPFPFYMMLMTDPRYRAMPWAHTHLWIVDERCVSVDHEKSNWRQIHEIFAEHSGIPEGQMHPIDATLPNACERYEASLRAELAGAAQGRLDFALLGMGDNGHTASLFPQTPVLDERERWVAPCDGPSVTPPPRITMTYPLLNGARMVAVLVVGAGKAAMIRQIATGADDLHTLPIKGIHPESGNLAWFLDRAAASQ